MTRIKEKAKEENSKKKETEREYDRKLTFV